MDLEISCIEAWTGLALAQARLVWPSLALTCPRLAQLGLALGKPNLAWVGLVLPFSGLDQPGLLGCDEAVEGGGKCRVGVGFLAFLLVIYVAASNKEELCVCVCVCCL